MFSTQSIRQLSTSPPPFSFPAFSAIDDVSYPQASTIPPYRGEVDVSLYPQYMQPVPACYPPILESTGAAPLKANLYNDNDWNVLNMSYASTGGMEQQQQQPQHFYDDAAAYVSITRNPHLPPPQLRSSNAAPQQNPRRTGG